MPATSPPLRRTLIPLLLLGLTLGAQELPPGPARVDLQALRRPASLVAAALSELLGAQHVLEHDLVDAGEAGRELSLILVGAGRETAIQALAHALDCWWAPDSGGEVRYSRSPRLPVVGPLEVRTYTSRLTHRPHLEEEVRALMAPWLDGQRGLVLHAPLGRWTATLDRPGQRELEALLTRLERPRVEIPPLVPHPAQPAAHRALDRRLEAADAPALLAALSAATGCSVSLRRTTADPTPLVLHPAPLHELPLQLAAQGLPAAWIRGVLCCGDEPHDRLHPGLRRRFAMIPVAHLAPDRLAMTALLARLERDAAAWWWNRPGAGLLALEEAGMLLVATDDEALMAVLQLFQRLDQQGAGTR